MGEIWDTNFHEHHVQKKEKKKSNDRFYKVVFHGGEETPITSVADDTDGLISDLSYEARIRLEYQRLTIVCSRSPQQRERE